MTKTRKHFALIVEQRVTADTPVSLESWKHVTTVSDYRGASCRSYQYKRAMEEGQTMLAIWGEGHPIRVRAQHSKGEDVLTLEQVESIGRALYERENT